MKTLKSLCSLGLLLITTASFAQDEVIIIDRKDFRKKREREIKLNDNVQIIKFAPLQMLAGEINFGYERQLSKKGSIDLELGPTISNIGFGLNNHFVDPFSPHVTENSGLGIVLSAGYRYYPLDETEALNRFYVSPVVKLKVMNSTYEDLSGFLEETRKGGRRMANFYFNFGYQFWPAKTFSIDLYGGFGIGMQDRTSFYSEQIFDGNTNTWNSVWVENKSSGAVFVGNFGVKVGIGSK